MNCSNCKHWLLDRLDAKHDAAPCGVLKIGIGSRMNLLPMKRGRPVYTLSTFGCKEYVCKDPRKEVLTSGDPKVQALIEKARTVAPKRVPKKKKTAKKNDHTMQVGLDKDVVVSAGSLLGGASA